jgi:superfamily II DNA or RNA helicase
MEISADYSASGTAVSLNSLGMRTMQARVYEHWPEQRILLKSPPASGKSRALMFVALEKLKAGQVKRIIVSVPEKTIGASFRSQMLSLNGFHSDWNLLPENDLCSSQSETGKVKRLQSFLEDGEGVLVCTHSTLRGAYLNLGADKFDECLVAIDEFHHVSSSEDSRLGALVRELINRNKSHIFAMTGSYFRGDSEPILQPNDEEKFSKVTYSYYEQLDGYEHLKRIEIGMSFYRGTYLDSIANVFDEHRKTIIHIPSVNSGESTKEKYFEVASILDSIGTYKSTDVNTGIITVTSPTGRELKIADLVNDNSEERFRVTNYLRAIQKPEDLDVIIALGMAKEGFDWPFCEVALTVGYRASMTELVQIIGRTTRDAKGKEKATFVNFVAEPVLAENALVTGTNNIFKAIAASLLMEDVLAPRAGFLENRAQPIDIQLGQVKIRGFDKPTSERVASILEHDLIDLRAKVFQDDRYGKAALGATTPEILNKHLTPKIIREIYPQLDDGEIRSLSEAFVVSNALRSSSTREENGQKFLKVGNSFVLVEDLDLDLIFKINPFNETFEVVSKELNTEVLREIQDLIRASRSDLTKELASELWPSVNEWFERFGKEPSYESSDPQERILAEVLSYMRDAKRNSHKNDSTSEYS